MKFEGKYNFFKKIAAISCGLPIFIFAGLPACNLSALYQSDVEAVANTVKKIKISGNGTNDKLIYYYVIKNFFKRNNFNPVFGNLSLLKIDEVEKILLAGAMIIDFNKKIFEFESRKIELNAHMSEMCKSLVWLHKFYAYIIENTESMLNQGTHPEKGASLKNSLESYKIKLRMISEIFEKVMPDGYLNHTEDVAHIWNRVSSKAYFNLRGGIVSQNYENLLYFTGRYHIWKACRIEKVFNDIDVKNPEMKNREEEAKFMIGGPLDISRMLEARISESIKKMHNRQLLFKTDDESKFLEGIKKMEFESPGGMDTSITMLKMLYASRFESKMILCENYSSAERRQRIQNICDSDFFEATVFYSLAKYLNLYFKDYYFNMLRINVLTGTEAAGMQNKVRRQLMDIMLGVSKLNFDNIEEKLTKIQEAEGEKPIDSRALIQQMKECKGYSKELKDMLAVMYDSRKNYEKEMPVNESQRKEALERISDSLDILDIYSRLNENNYAYKVYVPEIRKYISNVLKMDLSSNTIKFKDYYSYYKNHPEKMQPGMINTDTDVPDEVRIINDKIKENMYYMLKESEEILNQEEVKYKKIKNKKKKSTCTDSKKKPEKPSKIPEDIVAERKKPEEKAQDAVPVILTDSNKSDESKISPETSESDSHKMKQIQEKEEFQKNQAIRNEKWKEEVARKRIAKEKDKASEIKEQVVTKTESTDFFEKHPHKIELSDPVSCRLEKLRKKGNGGDLLSKIEEFLGKGTIEPGRHLKNLGGNRYEQYMTRGDRVGFEIGKNKNGECIATIRSLGGHFDSAKDVDKAFGKISFGGTKSCEKYSGGSE